jgi:ATP-dependent Lhr-like helicase
VTRDPLDLFHPAVREWFTASFGAPTPPQALGWPAIARGDSTLVLSPTGSGKTLAAFLWCINRLMFEPVPDPARRCRILYVSPLKALAVDVERNLRAPLAGIANLAESRGDRFVRPAVAIRTGDTPASERAQFRRQPADILITTPESLYLLLTSRARDALRAIETVIVDEIHALVPTKRGAHLALSLERLQVICARPLQRIGLSATQRPLDEVARFLGGARVSGAGLQAPAAPKTGAGSAEPLDAIREELHGEFEAGDQAIEYRPVTIVDTRQAKRLRLKVEVPVEDMAKLAKPIEIPSGPAAQPPVQTSIWASIHPRLLDLVRRHKTTLIFANSRRLAERLAGALNELAGEQIVRAHHGSLARPQRVEIEDALKAGRIPALVATSSLELGIDMGAVDLVIQIEAPPSVASGMQRIGRASHQVDAVSEGTIFPKFRSDLVAAATVTKAMHEGRVEATHYPRNPLDVLAQQIVAMVAVDPWRVDDLFATVRSAAPFSALSRQMFEGVLDMLSGRYPSDDFAELRPRVTWDRIAGTLTTRQGAQRVAIANGGTIPDRGLYGVFLSGASTGTSRVGELDEEMVFESRVGETFLLGASTWRIEEITHDRVLVSPAPGEPGKMPFWHGDRPGRPLELGLAIGQLIREVREMPANAAVATLTREHDLDKTAAENLVQYLADQQRAAGAVPDDRTVVIERGRDELGDWRVCLLAPFGAKVLAPWAMAAEARIREEKDLDVETLWSDDGFVVRFPDTDEPPDPALLVPRPQDVERLLVRQLGGTALFAARFREVAARALLLPRRRPGARTALWQQRKRAADLLAVASRYGSFPAVLETYRECLRDVFDVPALADILARVADRSVRIVTVDSEAPSPFAASLLFSYVGNFIYDGDAPLAERRAQALLVDQAQLRDLLGDIELRELLDPAVIDGVEAQLQHTDPRYRARSADALHDLLLRVGDLAADEIAARSTSEEVAQSIHALVGARRAIAVPVRTGPSVGAELAPPAGERAPTVGAGAARFIAVEDAARYRDALGIPLPQGLPEALLAPAPDGLRDIASRYARTHGPFTTGMLAARYALAPHAAEAVLARLAEAGRLVQGEFRPGRTGHEWCEAEVLRQVRQRSLARLRHEVEPVEAAALGRLATTWQGLATRRKGLDALLDAIEQLQGAPLVASLVEREILPARLDAYSPADLDFLAGSGEMVWVGLEPLGERDGRIALYLTDHLPKLLLPSPVPPDLSDRARAIVEHLRREGASFFAAIHEAAGGGYPGETVDTLWDLAWRAVVTNDTFHALRAFTQPPARRSRRDARAERQGFRSRRLTPPTAEGRWSLVGARAGTTVSPTERATALAWQLLNRHGVLTREAIAIEQIPGGFSAVYDVLKALEENGRIRRGYFVANLGATQFALPAAVDLLRSLRDEPDTPQTVYLAATDPANPYGAVLRWPLVTGSSSDGPRSEGPRSESDFGRRTSDIGRQVSDLRGPTRSAGTGVILVNGALAAYLTKGDRALLVFLPEDEPARSTVATEVARMLFALATGGSDRPGMLIADINGMPATTHPLAEFLLRAGFHRRPTGFQAARPRD